MEMSHPVEVSQGTDPPARGYEAEPSPQVPAYTAPAQVVSVFPGAVPCVRDLHGGQRFRAT